MELLTITRCPWLPPGLFRLREWSRRIAPLPTFYACVHFWLPDAIPETIITEGASHLGSQLASVGADPYLLNQAIETLRAYSLVCREASSEIGTQLSVHRLVQAVLRDQMDEQSRQQWRERTVRAVNAAFPSGEHQTWPQCDRRCPCPALYDLDRGWGR